MLRYHILPNCYIALTIYAGQVGRGHKWNSRWCTGVFIMQQELYLFVSYHKYKQYKKNKWCLLFVLYFVEMLFLMLKMFSQWYKMALCVVEAIQSVIPNSGCFFFATVGFFYIWFCKIEEYNFLFISSGPFFHKISEHGERVSCFRFLLQVMLIWNQ